MYNLVKPVKDWICGQCGEELETCAEFMEHVNHFHTRLNRNEQSMDTTNNTECDNLNELNPEQSMDATNDTECDDLSELNLNREDIEALEELLEELRYPVDDEVKQFYAEEFTNYRNRFCPKCNIRFKYAGDLDCHRYKYHSELYTNYEFPDYLLQEGRGFGPSLVKFDLVESAFEGVTRVYEADLTFNTYRDIFGVFRDCKREIVDLLQKQLVEFGSYKVDCNVLVEMARKVKDSNEEETQVFPFNSCLHTCFHKSMISKVMGLMSHKIDDSIQNFLRCGSGWRVRQFLSMRFSFSNYQMDRPEGYIPTPKEISTKKCIVNVRNKNEFCFKYAILSGYYPIYRNPKQGYRRVTNPNTYDALSKEFPNNLNFSCVKYPVTIDQLPKFLKHNPQISLNVFCYTKRNDQDRVSKKYGIRVFPLFVANEVRPIHMDLLLLYNDFHSHYTLLKSSKRNPTEGLSRLLGKSERKYEKFICYYCLCYFKSLRTLEKHKMFCAALGMQRVVFPKEQFYSFNHYRRMVKVPYIIYCDFEAILRPKRKRKGNTEILNEHIDCGWCYCVVGPNNELVKPAKYYCGIYAAQKLLEELVFVASEYTEKILEYHGLPKLTNEDRENLRKQYPKCIYCNSSFNESNKAVVDHDHVTGEIRGLSCNHCNLEADFDPFIPVVFHSLRSYDAHFIFQALRSSLIKDVNIIPLTGEKYMSFSLRTHGDVLLKFLDSYQFLSFSLDTLVKTFAKDSTDSFRITKEQFSAYSSYPNLLFQKGIYPYSYIDSFSKFNEKMLPPKEAFHNDLTDADISDDDYQHALRVWDVFNCESIKDYHNIYVSLDTTLLADCFEYVRNLIKSEFGIDPAHYISLPGVAFDAAMIAGNVEYENLNDIEKQTLFERGIRGGMCITGLRYAKANNPYLGKYYDPKKPKSYLMYWDANLLYSGCLRNYLPYRNFRWKAEFFNSSDINKFVELTMNTPDEGTKGFIAEIDLEYPTELHDSHNDFPLAPQCLEINYEDLSEYTKSVMNIQGVRPGSLKHKKLVGDLRNKNNYVVHYRILKLYLELGLKVSHVHCVLEFEQAPIFKAYVERCIEKRRSGKTEFDKVFWKSMGNILFGKTLENVRKRRRINVALRKEKAYEYTKKPTVDSFRIIHNNCVLFNMKRQSVLLDKPIYIGMTVLEDSKRVMFDFYYNKIKKMYGDKAHLVYSDTDSGIIYIITEDVYEDVYNDIQSDSTCFDTSNYDPNHPLLGKLFSEKKKGMSGCFKDECSNTPMLEAVALKPKSYAVRTLDLDESIQEKKRAKGTLKNIVKNTITFDDYLKVLNEAKVLSHNMRSIRSFDHKLYTVQTTKNSLSCLEDKGGYYISPIQPLRFGHYLIPE